VEPPILVVRAEGGRSVKFALPIAELFAIEDAARALMLRALSADRQAGAQVETIFALADDPTSSEQARSLVWACCLERAMREIQEQRRAWAQQQPAPPAQQRAPTPAPVSESSEGPPAEGAAPVRARRAPAPPPPDIFASCPHGLALDLPCPDCQTAEPVRAAPAAPPPRPRAAPAPGAPR
jgi:hypothetical protein